MNGVVLGALLGLGIFVLVTGPPARRLATRLAPHLRDAVPAGRSVPSDKGASRVLIVLAKFPLQVVRARRARRRSNRRVTDELPAVLDLISLCIAAGMSIPAALGRIGTSGVGIIPDECRVIAAEIDLGASVADALRASDDRLGHDGWSRLIEHLLTARQRGTPLAEIVRFLADDEQRAAGRRLLESASAKETAMMVPLVFVILPVTVIVAIFPGIRALGALTL